MKAEEEQIQRSEELTELMINKKIQTNKKQHKKALKVLGRDPSMVKIQNTFGEDYERIRRNRLWQGAPIGSLILLTIPFFSVLLLFVLYIKYLS
jgi:hypothetical protein